MRSLASDLVLYGFGFWEIGKTLIDSLRPNVQFWKLVEFVSILSASWLTPRPSSCTQPQQLRKLAESFVKRTNLKHFTTAINPTGFQVVMERYGTFVLNIPSQSPILSLSSFIFWASTFVYSPQLKDDFCFAVPASL